MWHERISLRSFVMQKLDWDKRGIDVPVWNFFVAFTIFMLRKFYTLKIKEMAIVPLRHVQKKKQKVKSKSLSWHDDTCDGLLMRIFVLHFHET